MFKKLWDLYHKYKEAILYLFFGGLTTLFNIVTYAVCSHIFNMDTLISNGIAWVVGVAFAYVTNKLYVFESHTDTIADLVKECVSFVGCRLATGVMDMAIMYITVDILHWPDIVMKIIANVLVIVLNFVFSKLFIFAGSKKEA